MRDPLVAQVHEAIAILESGTDYERLHVVSILQAGLEMRTEPLSKGSEARTMWVYQRTEKDEFGGTWTVGYYNPEGFWIPESDHASPDRAACRVNFLNGGIDPELLLALQDLAERCDGEEGVREDGSNIDTMRASMILAKLGF